MDPLTALSLAAAVAQFVDFGFKVLGNAREVYGSLSGATEEDRSLENAARETQHLAGKLVVPKLESMTDEDRLLHGLAAECRTLSTQVLALLDKIKAKNSKSKLDSVLAAVKSKHYEKEKLGLQRRLEQCRVRLEQLLSALSRSETKDQIEQLVMASDRSGRYLSLVLAGVEQLRQGSELTFIGPRAREQLQDLLGFSQEMCTRAAQRAVLNLIAFPEMRDRVNVVEKAHESTFRWIFDEAPDKHTAAAGNGSAEPQFVPLFNEIARTKMNSFICWLSSGTGVYHIAGKLGSGKSTLMKYLSSHPRVHEELQTWAGDNKLVVASFFFWRRGTTIQRSLTGLLRTLLHDILSQRPELIPEVLADVWSDAASSPGWSISRISRFQLVDGWVQSAFTRLQHCSALCASCKICLFIDGLDEYEETIQNDYKAMLQLLLNWTEVSQDAVKICVSSREYNVFINFFADAKRLRLHDLTLADMQGYVRARLQDLEENFLERLVHIVTEKANGIFLWVALVVKSIRARLEDGFGLASIEEEVNMLPDELEGLFQHLLDSIRKPYRKQAYQTFALIEQARATGVLLDTGIRPLLGLLGYSFLDEYNIDPVFAQKLDQPPRIADGTGNRERMEIARKQLNARCQGLVELNPHDLLLYTHRSVSEFLTRHLEITTASTLADFRPAQALSQLLLAEIRCRPADRYWVREDSIFGMPRISGVLVDILRIRAHAGLDCSSFDFLESLDAAAHLAIPSALEPHRDRVWEHMDLLWSEPGSVLRVATYSGSYSYVIWRLEREPGIIADDWQLVALIMLSINGGLELFPVSKMDPFRVVRHLLRMGISPEKPIFTKNKYSALKSMSIWEYLVLRIVECVLTNHRAAEIIQDCLEHGASAHLQISLESQPPEISDETPVVEWELDTPHPQGSVSADEATRGSQTTESRHYFPLSHTVDGRLTRPIIKFRFGEVHGGFKTVSYNAHAKISNRSFIPGELQFYEFIVANGGSISFEELVEYVDFHNKAAILELCARNKHMPSRPEATAPETGVNGHGIVPQSHSEHQGGIGQGQSSEPEPEPWPEPAEPSRPEGQAMALMASGAVPASATLVASRMLRAHIRRLLIQHRLIHVVLAVICAMMLAWLLRLRS